MKTKDSQTYTAFNGHSLLVHGGLEQVVLAVKNALRNDPTSRLLVFSDTTGKQMDFDLSGSDKEVLQRIKVFVGDPESEASLGPGRPKLGVISREISLLPQHWEWLTNQSGGASAVLRRLVDDARKSSSGKEQIKQAQERAYKIMHAIAGDFPFYEEATRALFAKDRKKFETQIRDWPRDIKKYAMKMADTAFSLPR